VPDRSNRPPSRSERFWRRLLGRPSPPGELTDRARSVLVLAQEEARLLNHSFIGTEHILLGLIHEGKGLAAKALESFGISLEAVRSELGRSMGPLGSAPTGSLPFTPRAKEVLELSKRDARQLGHDYVGTGHLLLGLVREGEGVAAMLLIKLGADLGRVRQRVVEELSDDEGGGSDLASSPQGAEHLGIRGSMPAERRTSVGRLELSGEGEHFAMPSASWVVAIEVVGRDTVDYAQAFSGLGAWLEARGLSMSALDPADIAIVPLDQGGRAGFQLQVRREVLLRGDGEPES
jgi:hypothetical protein